MTTIELRHERDYAAWYAVFASLNRQAEEIEATRGRIVQELGFEQVHVREIREGNTVRAHGAWYQVDHVEQHLTEDSSDTGYPYWLIVFEGAQGTYEVEANHPENPWAPLVTRLWDESAEAF